MGLDELVEKGSSGGSLRHLRLGMLGRGYNRFLQQKRVIYVVGLGEGVARHGSIEQGV